MKAYTAAIMLGLLPAIALAEDPPLPATEAAVNVRWQDAGQYLDRDCVVFGRVVRTKTLSNWCFLNFDQDYRTTFTVAIPSSAFDKFPNPPEVMYADKDISVCGHVVEFKGKPEIVVSDPKQITIGATFPDAAPAADKKPDADEKPAADIKPADEKPAPALPPAKPYVFDGTCTVATFNVLNLFDEHDDPYHGDDTTPAKPREELEQLAQTIRRVNADVLALEEVENRGYLERFVKAMIPDLGYDNVVLFEGNDYRGIDVALLSRLPVGPVTSYRHLRFKDPNGEEMSFRRDLLQVRLEPPGVPGFDVFVVHLKSKHGGEDDRSLAVRLGETMQIRKILDGLLADDPAARFVICGDFNDTLDSKPVTTIIGSGAGALGVLVDDLPADQRVTYNREPYCSMIDFILVSPEMAKRYQTGSGRVLQGSVSSSGSDHNPVSATFNLK